MKYGFVKTACCSPKLKVADVEFNTKSILQDIAKAESLGAELIVFPELSLTGSTCGDLFFLDVLVRSALKGLEEIIKFSVGKNAIVLVGLPFKKGNLLYDVAVAVSDGKALGVIPKTVLCEDARYFATAPYENDTVTICNCQVPFGTKIIFADKTDVNFTVGVEIGKDGFSPLSPSAYHVLNGANIIVNLNAECETVGGAEYRNSVIKTQSGLFACGYAFASASSGESTTDCVYGGQKIIAECGKVLGDSKIFNNDILISEIDVDYISRERIKNCSLEQREDGYETVCFDAYNDNCDIIREYEKTPFVPSNAEKSDRAELILNIQSEGLKKRVEHTCANSLVLGLSGGLDSTLAILVAVTAMKKLNRPLKDVVAVTMPCFGTTSRTFENTVKLAKALGVTLKKVDISKSVTRHLKDIKHADGVYDVTFENAQARERTQVLMDIANMNNGLVIGTGDLSEMALGWATYNGDHMSMYGVNCSVPKTLVRHVVEWYADASKGKLKAVLKDILDTPVSPELLPVENDAINQKTEDIVGPYILHDFFLYHMIRKGFSPKKIYFIACKTFKNDFKCETILRWLKIFVKRFFIQQFKRSCVPDGVKVGTVSLSPRGAWKMPSDAVSKLWLEELENL